MRMILGILAVSATVSTVAADSRIWIDNTGKYRVVAELVEADDRSVTLRRSDGRTIIVPLERLSQQDRAYIRGLKLPARVRQFLKKSEEARQREIERIQTEITTRQRHVGKHSQGHDGTRVQSENDSLARLNAELDSARDRSRLFMPTIDPLRMRVGDIGRFRAPGNMELQFRVDQVISIREALIDSYYSDSQQAIPGGLVQVSRPDFSRLGHRLWFSGIDTRGLVDGVRYEPEGAFAVTRRYGPSADSTESVFVVEPVDLSAIPHVKHKGETYDGGIGRVTR